MFPRSYPNTSVCLVQYFMAGPTKMILIVEIIFVSMCISYTVTTITLLLITLHGKE